MGRVASGAAVATALAMILCSSPRVRAATGIEPFADSRDPPSARALDASERARFDLGHAVFNTHWVAAGTPRAARRDGVGPLFNADSCDECHNEGAHGRGPAGDGPAPPALVVKLESRLALGRDERAGVEPDARDRPDRDRHPGDPVYGHVLNTAALDGLAPEGTVLIHYDAFAGRYPDGEPYSLRVPHYRLTHLRYGPLARDTIIEPRIAPAIFGDGLLEAVVDRRPRFNWQGTAVSVRDQTNQAFAREMGLTNPGLDRDDCTAYERDCLGRPSGGDPEVAPQLLDAVVFFERLLAVPQAPQRAGEPLPAAVGAAGSGTAGAAMFASVGCADCHTPYLIAEIRGASGAAHRVRITPYTDLRLHDMGERLADEDAAGRKVRSRWRTAPLWGLGYRLARERTPTLLHDGRARSVEEAVLWHDGEAAGARERFERLRRRDRQALLAWLGSL